MVGMIAMLWVGGGILVHGLHALGYHAPEEMIHHAAESVAHLAPSAGGILNWVASAGIAAVLGLIVGAIVDPLVNHVISPLIGKLRGQSKSA
jgi:predicted DNA repair protein MutK